MKTVTINVDSDRMFVAEKMCELNIVVQTDALTNLLAKKKYMEEQGVKLSQEFLNTVDKQRLYLDLSVELCEVFRNERAKYV